MTKPYHFNVTGHGAEGAPFECIGEMVCEFADSFNQAMEASFRQLTNGRAIYGAPGVGCRGPYSIRRIVIEEIGNMTTPSSRR